MVNSLPTQGHILVNGSIANSFTQEDIMNNLVMYLHDAREIGVNEAHDNFNLTMTDDPDGRLISEFHRVGNILLIEHVSSLCI